MKKLHLEALNLTQIGEAIDKELAAKMIKDFQDSSPTEVKSHYIGRDIILKILSQPACVGIRFYNAINEEGKKTLVYVGIDENEQIIDRITLINSQGEIEEKEGIVADRTYDWDKDNDKSLLDRWS